MLNCSYVHMYCILGFFTTGNFGVVYEAYYIKEDSETKVAIKTLQGDYYYYVYVIICIKDTTL